MLGKKPPPSIWSPTCTRDPQEQKGLKKTASYLTQARLSPNSLHGSALLSPSELSLLSSDKIASIKDQVKKQSKAYAQMHFLAALPSRVSDSPLSTKSQVPTTGRDPLRIGRRRTLPSSYRMGREPGLGHRMAGRRLVELGSVSGGAGQ